MVELYARALSQEPLGPYASAMRFALAEEAFASGRESEGLALLAAVCADPRLEWSVKASLRAPPNGICLKAATASASRTVKSCCGAKSNRPPCCRSWERPTNKPATT